MDVPAMRSVAVIGLGLMGAALARALKASGLDVYAWTRSAIRRRDFSDDFIVHTTAIEAVNAAEVTVLCITNFASFLSCLVSRLHLEEKHWCN
jgi:3-hydroxyisobutyrate dehydrogenase-like beta-hydroxyacid dehydrogenase